MSLLIFLFLCIFGAIMVASAVAFSFLESQRKKQVADVLQTVSGEAKTPESAQVLVKRPDQEDAFRRLLHSFERSRDLQTRIMQAGLEWDLMQLGLATVALAIIGFFLGLRFNILLYPWLSAITLACTLPALPYVYLSFKRSQRFSAFEAEFPEALDFLARSMRAGHAFSVSLEMLGAESPDPLGREFRTLFNEQNLGASIEVALANLARRMPLLDVRFFVSSVMLQRQTGGNLSEILTRLGYVIRERFRLRGQVKAASAHGRITAVILTVMPIFLTVALSLLAPTYLGIMIKDPDGKYLIVAAVFAQLLGYYFIRRIVNIKV